MAYVYGTTSSDILNADDGITSGDDTVYAGDGHDTIRGLGGHDILYGEDGRDTIYGGDGVDWLDGGKNDDSLFGGDDNDYLLGQDGADELDGGKNDDYLAGGAGAGNRPWRILHGARGPLQPEEAGFSSASGSNAKVAAVGPDNGAAYRAAMAKARA